MRFLVPLLVYLFASTAAHAVPITFSFSEPTTVGHTTYSDTVSGLTLTIDNPNGNILFGNNTFGFLGGGLFIDGGFAPNLDFTFSQDVKLMSYEIAFPASFQTFDLTQGALSSLGQTTNPGPFLFSNTTDTFLANVAISSVHSLHDEFGYSIGSLTVDTVSTVPEPTVPEPTTTALLALGLLAAGLGVRRRRLN